MKKYLTINLLIGLIIILFSTSCLDEQFEDIEISNPQPQEGLFSGFEFNTTEEISVTVTALDFNNKPLNKVYFEFYIENPFNESNQLKKGIAANCIYKGTTNKQGIVSFIFRSLPYHDSLYVVSGYIGLPQLKVVNINSNNLSFSIGGHSSFKSAPKSLNRFETRSSFISEPQTVNNYYVLGTWNNKGVPDYLEPINDIIDQTFLNDVNASLPENKKLTESHPQYLNNANDANLIINEDCEIWVTFVHEGAGWLNMLGYYTFDTDLPPTSINEIRDLTVIFPNVSYRNSGGGLLSGNKVQLHYLDPETNKYSSIFPANTTVGWFITSQGWNGQTITNGIYTHYSNVEFNVEDDDNKKKHNVLLYDEARELLLLGFEDIRRDKGSDEDFNDAVFYTTVSPFSAISQELYQPIDKPLDSDNDGITDVFDEYPQDPSKALNNYYPSKNGFGTLVFEDLWPYKGDYDFNDLVIDYNFKQVSNADNAIVEIESQTVVRAIGASYHNSFGIQLNTPTSNISGTSGQKFSLGFLDIQENGAESNQTKATIIYFDNAYNMLPYAGSDICVNTYPNAPYVSPDTQLVNIKLILPETINNLGTPPYNPFIIVDKKRGIEIHLPNSTPTDLADQTVFGTGHDDSQPAQNKYYISDNYLPWAINLPISFDYPAEKEDITLSYNMFNPWAISLGFNYMDWYSNKNGYRNNDKIYKRRNN